MEWHSHDRNRVMTADQFHVGDLVDVKQHGRATVAEVVSDPSQPHFGRVLVRYEEDGTTFYCNPNKLRKLTPVSLGCWWGCLAGSAGSSGCPSIRVVGRLMGDRAATRGGGCVGRVCRTGQLAVAEQLHLGDTAALILFP